MKTLLNKEAVADRIGVRPKTAAALMMEMNPIPITGNVRHKWVVTEENLERWIARKMIGKPKTGSVQGGSKKRLERR